MLYFLRKVNIVKFRFYFKVISNIIIDIWYVKKLKSGSNYFFNLLLDL